MNSIDEKTALIELTDAELYEVAGGNFVFISNQGVQVSGIQGVQVSGIQGVQVSGIFGHRAFKSVRHFW
jgi:hypothetical protein